MTHLLGILPDEAIVWIRASQSQRNEYTYKDKSGANRKYLFTTCNVENEGYVTLDGWLENCFKGGIVDHVPSLR